MKFLVSIYIVFLFLLAPALVCANEQSQNTYYEGKISKILEEKEIDLGEKKQTYQKLEVNIVNKDKAGQTIVIENGNLPMANVVQYKAGDEVVILASKDIEGKDIFYVTDYVRRNSLKILIALFLILVAFIGRKRGLSSVLGMIISFIVLFSFVLPQLLNGSNPTLVSLLAALILVPTTFYLSHGFNKKTTVAVFSTLLTLLITIILANLFISSSKISGFASEEAAFLQVAKAGALNIKGLLLAGIIIGAIGILDDITVSQAAVVSKLKETSGKLMFKELFEKGMSVGRDHIASMVNTLVLVYVGAALPLLLLFINNPHPLSEVVNYEIVSEEIVRTLVGSIGLVLAVPITTFIAAFYFSSEYEKIN